MLIFSYINIFRLYTYTSLYYLHYKVLKLLSDEFSNLKFRDKL